MRMRNRVSHIIYKIYKLSGRVVRIIKYCIFVVKYFEQPLTILKRQAKREDVQVAKLRKGGIFNTFGYGSAASGLYRIWGDYEYGIRPRDVKKYRTVIDVGANVGLFSVFCGLLNPECKIFCFEIGKDNYEKLKQNIKNCKLKNVIPFNLAVAGKSQVINYYPGRDCSEFSITKISFNDEDLKRPDGKPTVEEGLNPIGKVKSITLNEIIEENNIDCVDFLKLDCEGAEFEILYATTEENLKTIKMIGGEYHEHKKYTADDLIAYLSRFGGDLKKIETGGGVGLIHYTRK
jgi:FkbM family methyltransferase